MGAGLGVRSILTTGWAQHLFLETRKKNKKCSVIQSPLYRLFLNRI